MIDNEKLLKAAITTNDMTGTGKGGKLTPEQSDKFIDYMVDNSEILKDIRVERMRSPEKLLDFLLVNGRIIRKATEGQQPSELMGVTTQRKELRSVKVTLPADISQEFLEDNIEREQARDHIVRMLSQQFSNDLADLLFNGDSTATGTDATFLTIGDGIIKQAKDSSVTHKINIPASVANNDYKDSILPSMLSALPDKYKTDRNDLRFYCASSVADAYILSLASRITTMGDNILINGNLATFLGVRLFPVASMPSDVIILTNKNNIVQGIQRDMDVHSVYQPRKDMTEYTMYMRVDPGKIVWDDALVIARK